MSNYIDKAKLANEITAYQASGTMSDAFVGMVQAILNGAVYSVCKLADHAAEDLTQTAWLRVLPILHKLDAEQDAFGYISTIAINVVRQEHKKKKDTAFSSAFGFGFKHAEDGAQPKPPYEALVRYRAT